MRIPARTQSPSLRRAGPALAALALGLGLLAGLARPARAQEEASPLEEKGEWTLVDRGAYGAVYLDTATVEPVEEEVFRVRTRWRFNHVQSEAGGTRYRTSVALRAVDCKARRMAIIAFADRDGHGVVRTARHPLYAAHWEPVRAKSVAERIANATCDRGRRVVLAAKDERER